MADIWHNGLKIIYDPLMGHHRLDPYPDKEVVTDYYRDDHFYSDHSPPDWFEKEKREYKAGLWNSYYQHLLNIGEQPVTGVLDYGAGCGWFLDYYRRRADYYYFAGVEPSMSAIDAGESALGPLPIRPKMNDFEIKTFNLIYLILVLEHIVNPVEFLDSLVSNHLADGGRLVIVVPNDMNPLQRRLNYTGYISPVHVNYFTAGTLRGVMGMAGLKILKMGATFPMELFPLMGINYFANDELGRKCHWFRLRLEKLFGWRIFNLYKKLYDRWGIGRELIFVGEK